MRPLFVVVAPPNLQHRTGVRQRPEQRLVQQFAAQPAIETLDEPILLRLAGRDVMPTDTGLTRPAQDGVRGQFGAVVADDRVWPLPSPANDVIEFSRNAPAGDRGVGEQCQAFSGGIVNLSTGGMLLRSVARWLGAGKAFARL